MPSNAQSWSVKAFETGRLDHFLARKFTGISRVFLQKLIDGGTVRINGKKARKGSTVKVSDVVDVDSFVLPSERKIAPSPDIPLEIVWSSSDLLVINKPPGLPTHPNDFKDRHTLANAVLGHYPEIADVGDDPLRPGIVHRLDTDTSGLMLVALNQPTFRYLRNLFDQRLVKKKYLALVLGDISTEGAVETAVMHNPRNPRKMMTVKKGEKGFEKSKEACTLYRPIERFGNYTLLEVRTLTGRMHQVRVHLGSIGHPLVGDKIYPKSHERALDLTKAKRHFLHSAEISFLVPPTNVSKTFESDLPLDLETVLNELREKTI